MAIRRAAKAAMPGSISIALLFNSPGCKVQTIGRSVMADYSGESMSTSGVGGAGPGRQPRHREFLQRVQRTRFDVPNASTSATVLLAKRVELEFFAIIGREFRRGERVFDQRFSR